MFELPKQHYYALIERKVVPITDLMQWARWYENARRNDVTRIAADTVGNWWVSTVFLSLDHQYFDGPPILFETMVFEHHDDPEMHGHCESMYRYSTIEEAEVWHKAIVESLRRHETDAVDKAATLLAIVRKEVFTKG
jgi:hypothetical protein